MDSEIISSAQNATVKHLRKLHSSAKHRREHNASVAEGIHLLASLMKSDINLQLVVCAESGLQNPEVSALIGSLDIDSSPIVVVKDSLFESTSQLHASVGVVSVFSLPDVPAVESISTDALLLEDVQDPGNLGAILRTAAAAGVREVFLSPGSSSAWSPKALRAGMGAQFDLQIHEYTDLKSVIESSSVPVLATELSGGSSLYGADMTSPVAWLFGNEGQGVSRSLLAVSSRRVYIPQAPGAVESLNVAAAVAVCLFEQRRQRLYADATIA